MKSYYIVKKVSKSLVLLSLIAIILSGGIFFVLKSKIGADTNTTKDYEITMDGSTVEGILANNIKSSEVTNYDYSANKNSDIEKVSGDCRLGSDCYLVWNKKSWNDPSIELEDRQNTPAWAFLQEVKSKAQNAGDSDGVNKINNVMANYVAAAFNKSLKPNFDFTSTSGSITIPYQKFYDTLNDTGVSTSDPYVEFYDQNGSKYAKMKFASSYPNATNNSAWLAASYFVVNSMIKPYKDAGLDSSEYENAIAAARKTYLFDITKEDSGKVMSFKYPNNILLSDSSNLNFEYKIDISKFTQPQTGYKTKIYIKPASKKDDNVFILYGPFTETDYQFSWKEATGSGYVDSSGKAASVSGDDYNLSFPQQYLVRVITYDGDTEKENILATVQTQNELTSSGTSEVSDGNSFLKISAKPAAVKQGDKVTATIEAINSTDPDKKIVKVVLYACTGTSSDVATNDSSTCTYKNKDGATEDAVKTAFTLGSNLTFDSSGKATLTSSWDTTNSSIGNHALMAKAFRDNSSDPYILNSKTAVTIQVTNSDVGGVNGGGDPGAFSNLLAGMFSKNASDSPTGSSIRTTGELITRVINILLVSIGALSVIAIIIGGIFYITSGGDQQKAERGKKTVLYACIGIAIAVLVYVIEGAVINIINRLIS